MPAAVKLIEGKGAFVRRQLPDGKIEDICECIWNADFSVRGCIAQVHGNYIDEVIKNNGKYDEGTLPQKRKEHGINHVCEYCYVYGNWGQVTPKVVNSVTENCFKEIKPEFVRLGKNTECGHDIYIPTLMNFLDLCLKYNSKIIFPTKMLRYNPNVAKKLAEVGGVIHRSIGGDRFEVGPASQGYTNEWRVEQARLDSLAGVNEDLTLVCDVTQSIDAKAHAGFYVVKALEASRNYNLPVRILPIRLNSEKLARMVTSHSMQELRNTLQSLPGYEMPLAGLWKRRGNNELAPKVLHPDFERLYQEGIGFCGEVGDDEYCDKCNLCPSKSLRIIFPLSEKPKVTYTKKIDAKGRNDWKKREKIKAQKEHDKLQGKLVFD
jgi:hypothetical protein